MQTIKTFVVVGLLLAVCYGAIVALNAPDVSIPEELEQWANSTNGDALRDFEIPVLTMPEPFATPNITSELPKFPSSASDAITQLPSLNSSALPEGQLLNDAESGRESFSSQQSFPIEQSASSGATLTSVPETLPRDGFANSSKENPYGSPMGEIAENMEGPSIPFSPDIRLDDSAINELISAAGEFSSTSPQDFKDLPPQDFGDSHASSTEEPEIGKLASKSAPNSHNSNAPRTHSTALQPFSVAREQALEMAGQGKMAEALDLMSEYYESAELGYAEHTDLVDILDALAREVIYSDRPLWGARHRVSAQDTLASLSDKHRINPELLAAINKMGESQALIANTEIKVIDGPFRAQVSLSRGELTLFCRGMYAGRFPVSISQQNQPPTGVYEIIDRRKDRTFYGANTVIPAGAPTNPYGGFWLSLGGNYSIHGSPEQITSDLEGAGCISLAPLDAADVYRILGKGSPVEVRP